MIKIRDDLTGKLFIDERHCVDIINSLSHATAIVIKEDGTYDRVTYMEDDVRTWDNEAIIDATEEELETYRKYRRDFRIGDKVIITRGRKMLNETKEIKDFYRFVVPNTFGKKYTDYLVFTDGTKVNRFNVDFVREEE